MYYDLNIQWTANSTDLQRTLSFLADYYNVVALNHIITGKLPNELICPIPDPLPFATPPGLRILRRCTLILSDTSQNHRLAHLAAVYDILALRPTTEKALQLAIQAPEVDLLSLDLTQRLPFYFRPKTVSPAIQRGVRLEICYGPGVAAGAGPVGSTARRNLISNATGLIRGTRGRGLVLSSEAARALECRAPADASNLAAVWGLSPERAREAVSAGPRAVVAAAQMRRQAYRGVVAVVDGGARQAPKRPLPVQPPPPPPQQQQELGTPDDGAAPAPQRGDAIAIAKTNPTAADSSAAPKRKESRPAKRARRNPT